MAEENETFDLLDKVIQETLKAGCDAAEAVFVNLDGVSVTVRNGKLEQVERPAETALGLRAFYGHRQTSLSTSDLSQGALEKLVEQAAAIAKISPEDPYCGLACKEELLTGPARDLQIFDPTTPKTEALRDLALKAEAAAFEEKAISNSEGAEASWNKATKSHLTSTGFQGSTSSSSFQISAVVIAGKDDGMERDYDYSVSRYFQDLEPAEKIGHSAAERTIKRLNPKKVSTQTVPVIFEKRAAASLLGHFSGAINGAQVARGVTFLKETMDMPVFAKGINIIDDPLRLRGLASRPFDGEGVATEKRHFIKSGVLKSWLLDCPSARELGLKTTGHASRSLAGVPHPSPTNFYMENGEVSLNDMIKNVGTGFLVTELIGMGVNLVTGDYSRGATGFWIEKGEVAYPVNEVTIAGNLKDMFLNLAPASDLEFKGAVNAPSLLLGAMTVAGT